MKNGLVSQISVERAVLTIGGQKRGGAGKCQCELFSRETQNFAEEYEIPWFIFL